MPYLKPYSIPWLSFVAKKARMDFEEGRDRGRILGNLLDDLDGFVEHSKKKKQVRDVPEEVRMERSERMKAMRARGIGGWPKKGSKTPRNENDGVPDAQG